MTNTCLYYNVGSKKINKFLKNYLIKKKIYVHALH